jgi:tetratricopeptide (TPR) repeat protein
MASVMPADAKVAAGFLEAALKLDPDYAAAHALLAWCHEIFFARAGFNEADRIAGLEHARAVIASRTDDSTALAFAAFAVSILGKDNQTALSAIERALSLNPSCAVALYFGSLACAFAGRVAAATSHAERALRLSPFDPFVYFAHGALGTAALLKASYDEAASHFDKAVQTGPPFGTPCFFHAVSLALAGRLDEARPAVQQLLQLEPNFQSRIVFEVGYARSLADKLSEGARILGLPE